MILILLEIHNIRYIGGNLTTKHWKSVIGFFLDFFFLEVQALC